MHGPYGVVVQFENTAHRPDTEIEQITGQAHQFIASLPGYQAAVYYNLNEQQYCAVIAFDSEAATDVAIEQLRPMIAAQAAEPSVTVTKGEVVFAHLDVRLAVRG
jgi:hypothetical protein